MRTDRTLTPLAPWLAKALAARIRAQWRRGEYTHAEAGRLIDALQVRSLRWELIEMGVEG